jgi:hypothetical protein
VACVLDIAEEKIVAGAWLPESRYVSEGRVTSESAKSAGAYPSAINPSCPSILKKWPLQKHFFKTQLGKI